MNKHFFYILSGLAILAWLAAACTGSPITATPTTAEQAVLPSATSLPPTDTPEPTGTATPLPTDTPEPTATATPEPTATPNPLEELSDNEYETLLDIAFSLYQEGLYEDELLLYTEMLKYSMKPEQISDVHSLRADTYNARGDYDAQIDDLLKALEAGSDDPLLFNNLCWSYAITERPEQALPYCEQAVAADPSPSHLDSRGLVYAMLGQQQAALEDFQAVLSDQGNATSAHDEAFYAERQTWVDVLAAGENPITADILVELREDSSPLASMPTATPAPTRDITFPALKAAIEEFGYEFLGVGLDLDGSQGAFGSWMFEGDCQETIELAGTETSLEKVDLTLSSNCSDDFISGEVFWLMSFFLNGPQEKAEAIVWIVNEVNHVIEEDQESTGEVQIGEATFKAVTIAEGGQTSFRLTVTHNQP